MRGRWLGALLALTLVSGCAGVPSRSEPVSVRRVNPSDVVGDNAPDVQVVPPGPTPHMSSRDVVDGFLKASSSGVDTGHQVARRFLTPNQAVSWQDAVQTTVYTGQLVDDGANGVVAVTTQQVASVAQDGSYQANDTKSEYRFALRKVKGEWRISNPPPGIYVRLADFKQNFRAADLYFLTPSRDAVVPDPRFFEVPSTALANRLMQALLAGPSQWLTPAVVSDVPRGASLRNAVVDDSPTLTVDLSRLGALGKSQLKGMSAQIVFTLAKATNSSVRILSDGQPLAVPGIPAQQQQADWSSYDAEALPASARLYVVKDGAVWTNDGKRAPGPAGKAYYELASVATPADGSRMAGLSHRTGEDQLFVGTSGGTLEKRFTATTLTPPTWGGQSSEVWTVRNGTDVIRVPAEGQPQVIASPEVAKDGPVTQLRLSRDGTRVAIIGGGGQLYIGRVSRGTDTVTIDGLRPVSPDQSGFTDVTWSTGDTLIGLAPNGTFSTVPWTVAIDGSSRTSISIDALPQAPTGIAAASDQLTVVSAKGELWYADHSGWTRMTTSNGGTLQGTAPAYPD